MRKVRAIISIIGSNNFILVHHIKERQRNGIYYLVSKIQTYTSYTRDGDIEALENCVTKLKKAE